MEKKYIFVTGGVVSGLGKGLMAASLGMLLKNRGYNIIHQKLDPYLNVDPGTMNPCEHGEVFVTDDGAETDLDLGHYERFSDVNLNKYSSVSTGKIYSNVIEKERRGEYLGSTVQPVPHITNEIKENIYNVLKTSEADIVITEIGGTVGEMETMAFLEAIRQVKIDKKAENVMFIHLTLIPYLSMSKELKTKPSQHSVRTLMEAGIIPDILVCRTEHSLDDETKSKLSLFCNVPENSVFENKDIDNIYKLPLELEKQQLATRVCERLNLEIKEPNLKEFQKLINKIDTIDKTVNIALVGKYVSLKDAYLSVIESLNHAGIYNNTNVNIKWIDSENLEKTKNLTHYFQDIDGILIPGGFGTRGVEGKINACKYARENNIPFFGICLGMQIATIEYARNVLNIKDATSEEFNQNSNNYVIHIMQEQKEIKTKGGTMRLGKYPCKITKNSKIYEFYNQENISERHRHRYEYNNNYQMKLEENGLKVIGICPDNNLVEIVSIENNKWFVACQFHPEFKSRINKPHPLFVGFIKNCIK